MYAGGRTFNEVAHVGRGVPLKRSYMLEGRTFKEVLHVGGAYL